MNFLKVSLVDLHLRMFLLDEHFDDELRYQSKGFEYIIVMISLRIMNSHVVISILYVEL